MSDKEDKIFEIVRKATERPRGHADHFQWPIDRLRAELGVVQDLSASLDAIGAAFFFDLKGRAQHDDPPDCEAVDKDGQRIAIEVTELVDENAIERAQALRRERKDQGNSPPVSEQWVNWGGLGQISDRGAEAARREERAISTSEGRAIPRGLRGGVTH
jgi:hypothetical protein